jgi:hypothetical protein
MSRIVRSVWLFDRPQKKSVCRGPDLLQGRSYRNLFFDQSHFQMSNAQDGTRSCRRGR